MSRDLMRLLMTQSLGRLAFNFLAEPLFHTSHFLVQVLLWNRKMTPPKIQKMTPPPMSQKITPPPKTQTITSTTIDHMR